MTIKHTTTKPTSFPFDAESFRWDNFEHFCLAWMTAGATLPNLTMVGDHGPDRLRVVDAIRMGNPGEEQLGIDLLLTMENGATWVVQCKHVKKFGNTDAREAIDKAKREFGPHNPAHYLFFVTGKVSAEATLLAHHEDAVTLWSSERLTREIMPHVPPSRCRALIRDCFGSEWAKVFFPMGDELLISGDEFFSKWDAEGRSFHHRASVAGRERELTVLSDFAQAETKKKVLMLSAVGGVGKSRLLREIARRVESKESGRSVRFINPNASPTADLPVLADLAHTTIIHDDAHRLDLSKEVLAVLSNKDVGSFRLVLSTRPGAEANLREQLRVAGVVTDEIEIVTLEKLSRIKLTELSLSILGLGHEDTARHIAFLSEGSAIVAVVGSELIRSGRLPHVDFSRDEHFRSEVFDCLEDEELAQAATGLPTSTRRKLLRTIALLSPWRGNEREHKNKMAEFLGIQLGDVEAACDHLQQSGLLVPTHKGLRISPDLLSDHLAYSACYDEQGRVRPFVAEFLAFFSEQHATVLQNLAEAGWRAAQNHGPMAEDVLTPIWDNYIRTFEAASFWDRSRMIERWAPFAVFQPARTLTLAQIAMELDHAEGGTGSQRLDQHEQVLAQLPSPLKTIAIWCNDHREHALDLLLDVHHIRSNDPDARMHRPFSEFAEVAKFENNYPDAPSGLLSWLENLIDRPDRQDYVTKPCALWEVALAPFFARVMQKDYWKNQKTLTIDTPPICPQKTRKIRDRAFRLLLDKLVPCGTVSAINALPALGSAFRIFNPLGQRFPELLKDWKSVEKQALKAIADTARRYAHPLVHFSIRRLLQPEVVLKNDDPLNAACSDILRAMPDTLEHQISVITLSYPGEFFQAWPESMQDSEWGERVSTEWDELQNNIVQLLIIEYPSAESLYSFLTEWQSECVRHGMRPKFGELFSKLPKHNGRLASELLQWIMALPHSPLHPIAAHLLVPDSGVEISDMEAIVRSGLASSSEDIVRSFIHAVAQVEWLQTPVNIERLFATAQTASPRVMRSLIDVFKNSPPRSWSHRYIQHLLEIPMPDALILDLARATADAINYRAWVPGTDVITQLMQRLEAVSHIPNQFEPGEFIETFAKTHPRLVFGMLKKRILRSEKAPDNESSGYFSVPLSDSLALEGLAHESDYNDIAKDLLEAMLQQPSGNRGPWKSLFIIAISRTCDDMESLLTPIIPSLDARDDLIDVCDLLCFEGSRLAYKHPSLIDALLKKALTLGADTFKETEYHLIRGARAQSRGYTNGILKPEYDYAKSSAEKTRAKIMGNPRLSVFYQKIIEAELKDAQEKSLREKAYENDW